LWVSRSACISAYRWVKVAEGGGYLLSEISARWAERERDVALQVLEARLRQERELSLTAKVVAQSLHRLHCDSKRKPPAASQIKEHNFISNADFSQWAGASSATNWCGLSYATQNPGRGWGGRF
jgi:hypothetical protein